VVLKQDNASLSTYWNEMHFQGKLPPLCRNPSRRCWRSSSGAGGGGIYQRRHPGYRREGACPCAIAAQAGTTRMMGFLTSSIPRKILASLVAIYVTTYVATAVVVYSGVRASILASNTSALNQLADVKYQRLSMSLTRWPRTSTPGRSSRS